jgi:hypothetical protein
LAQGGYLENLSNPATSSGEASSATESSFADLRDFKSARRSRLWI